MSGTAAALQDEAPTPSLGSALGLLGCTWTALAATQSLASGAFGAERSASLSFLVAATLVLLWRDESLRGLALRDVALVALAAAAGFLSFEGWLVAVWKVGASLGLDPAPAAPRAVGLVDGACLVVAAPLFEELLYRERLLPAVRARAGTAAAIVASAAAFAAPHSYPWQALGTFGVGLVLGTVWGATEAISLCIGYHAGLNLAGILVAGRPALFTRMAVAGSGVAAVLLALAIAADRHVHGLEVRHRGATG